MTYQITLIVQVLSIIILCAECVYVFLRLKTSGQLYLFLFCLATLVNNVIYLAVMLSTTAQEAAVTARLTYIGKAWIPLTFLAMVLQLCGVKIANSLYVLFSCVQGGGMLLALTSEYHNLFYNSKRSFVESGLFPHNEYGHALLYYVYHAFVLIYIIIGLVVLIRILIKEKEKTRKKMFAWILVAVIVMTLGVVFYFLGITSGYDSTSLGYALASVIMANVIFRYNLLDTLTVVRDNVVEIIEEGIVAVDMYGAIIYFNKPFKKLYAKKYRVLEHNNREIAQDIKEHFESGEVMQFDDQFYEITSSPMYQGKKKTGDLYVLNNITDTYNYMEELQKQKEIAENANAAKSSFLSLVSHEIRTPMNAIVGMTEMMLREDISIQQKSYLNNIKSSGDALLCIINDILDFSKIETGKLELIEEEYSPIAMLSDLSMIFLTRIGNKNVEMLFDVDKNLPDKLYGDALRLRQIIINLVNNATKFTDEGKITLSIKVQEENDKDIILAIDVSDTGQGIRDEDISKLFKSFSQVDSKKNHAKEGTGLGLAISKQLVEMMDGEIGVTSEYGKGSTFSFTVKQGRISDKKAAILTDEDLLIEEGENTRPIIVAGVFSKEELTDSFENLLDDYGLANAPLSGKCDFVFVDEKVYSEKEGYLKALEAQDVNICLLHNPLEDMVEEDSITVINKPLYTFNFCQTIRGEEVDLSGDNESYLNFVAPKAKVLVVDDNTMNLQVAFGLLAPLQMKLDDAVNGKVAIEKIKANRYDLVLMDHMMPVMDGIEATIAIRELEDEYYKKLPIIALTADATAHARNAFAEAGMDDFVSKPIDMKLLCAKLKKYLPSEFIEEKEVKAQAVEALEQEIVIEGIDVEEGIKNSGNEELFINLLGDFYKLIDTKTNKIRKCLSDRMIRDYTIEVHALKSTSRLIGALELSEMFKELEQLGNGEDIAKLDEKTEGVLELYLSYKDKLREYGEVNAKQLKEVPMSDIQDLLQQMSKAMDGFDLDTVDATMKELEECRIPEYLKDEMDSLRVAVADVAMEEIINLCNNMSEEINKEVE